MPGPISFSHPLAWDFLTTYGYVATFRTRRRKSGTCDTWCNRGRGEPKEFDVHVQEVGHVDLHDGGLRTLRHFSSISGMETSSVWRAAIEEVNGELPDEGWLYLVTVTENE